MLDRCPPDVLRCVAQSLRPSDLWALEATCRATRRTLRGRAGLLCALRRLRAHALVARFRADCRDVGRVVRTQLRYSPENLDLLFRLWWEYRRKPLGHSLPPQGFRVARQVLLTR